MFDLAGAILILVSDTKHVVLIHGTWARGDSWDSARAAFEERGYTVHTPTLRYHELPLEEGASKIAPLSMRDYTDDLVALADTLDSPPLLVGLSLGGLLAQLVAARTRHAGVVAACPSPAAGIFAPTPATLHSFGSLFGEALSAAKAVDQTAVSHYVAAVSAVGSQCPDRGGRPRVLRRLSVRIRACLLRVGVPVPGPGQSRYRRLLHGHHAGAGDPGRTRPCRAAADRTQDCGSLPAGNLCTDSLSDHLAFSGDALPATMGRIDDWTARNHLHDIS